MVENFSWLRPMGMVNTNFGRCEFSESMNTNSILSHEMIRNVYRKPKQHKIIFSRCPLIWDLTCSYLYN